ncbi:MAG: hemagglutinin repeat-containing protein, partial [Gammaproteobacteria bacterium]|nr:hemagglutinin repeat-containing protein [Gammaproteobacteria bacterium]
GLLSSKAGMTVALTGELNNQAGALIADGALQLDAQQLDNREQGVLSSKGNLRLGANQVDNRSGSIVSDASLDLKAEGLNNSQGQVASKGDLDVELDHLVQQGGELLSQGSLRLAADDIDNSQAGLIAATQGIEITAGNLNNSSGGEISSKGAVAIDAADLNNSAAGLVLGDAGLHLTVQRLLNHSLGVLSGRTGLVVRGDSLDNSQGGILTSQQMLNVQLSGALDNHDQGALLSEGALQLQAGALNNTRGVLSSAGALAITTGTLNNQGGKLVTDDQLNITSSALDNSQGGRISAKQALSIVTGQLDNQQQGQISGAAALSLTTDQLNNHNRGLITAKGIAQVRASGLDQHQGGELFSESALTLDLQGGALNNSGQGLIATPGVLLLNNLGAVDNSAGGEISSNQSFLLKASQLNNSAGRVISGQDLHLQITQALLNNLKGVLSAAKLNVAAASLDNSAAGVLASKGDIQVTLTGTLDNHDQGIVSAAQALSISSAALDNSGDGLLASGGDLQLSTGALNNQGGSLLSQAALDVSSAALDNRGGALSSQQGLTLSAAAVDNSDNGLITSAAGLTLSATRLDSSAGGEVSAKQDLQLTVSQLIQQQGRLIGEAGLRVDLKGGDLDNRGGLLSAQGPLSLLNLGTLDNRNAGEVSSRQSYSLTAKAIDNGEQGRLISAGNLGLDVDTGTLRNANGGLISGWQGLTLNAGNLDNSALGTLSSRDGALTVNLKGSERVLNNSGAGALVSKGALSIEAGSLNNSGQGILSSEGDLELRLTGALNNSDRGLIDSQGSLTANAGAVNNHSGQISSVKAANVNAASLDNQAGQLSSNAALNLTLSGNLINTLGKLASTGPLVLKAQAIDNQGGSLLSQSLLDLAASSLNNANGGTLAARKGLNLLLTGALNNSADGLIHSLQSTVDIRAQSLNNNGGTLGSQSDLRLVLDAKLDNQGGHIQSRAGNLDLQQASAVDNSGGVLSSLTGWLKLATAGLFNNDAGTTQAQALTISAQGVDNRDGHISALSGDTAINIGSATFNNQGGGLYAHQLLDVSAGTFNNQGAGQGQGGKVAAGQIDFGLSGALNNGYGILESSGTLGLTAASLDNRNGSLRALGTSGDTRITATSLDNRNGGIETANSNLDLNVASLQSAGGSILHVGTGNFGLNAAQVSGAGGDLRSNGLLSLTADNWTNSGVLQAGRLVLNVGTFTQTASGQLLANQSFTGSGSTWTNNGLLASDGSFSLNLSGAYSGSGQVTSLGSLSLSAGSVDLSPTARLSGGELTTVTSTGLLTNRGRLTSVGDLTLRAGILSNYGTLGSAQRVTFYVPELLNDHGLLFSGGSMSLWTSELNNRYGDIYSLGMLDIARNAAFNKSNSVVNFSGSIVSAEDARVFANTFYNDRDEPLIAQRISISRGQHHPAIFGGNSYSWIFEHSAFSYGYGSPRSSFESGGSLIFNVGNFNNTSGTVLAGEDISISADLFVNQGFTSNIDSGLISGAIETSAIRAIQSADRAGHLGDFSGLSNSGVLNNSSDVYYLFKPEGVKNFTVRPGDFGVSADSIDGLSNAPAPEQQAIIQAGGAVTITANNVLQNGVTREFLSDPPGLGLPALVRTDVNSTTKALDDINPQLSPNLQQQQVNPLTLPGFTLPQGENGLFRLSGQQAQSTTVQQASGAVVDRTLAGRSVALGQQEQSLSAVDIQGRSIAVTTRNSQAATQVAASDPQLSGSEPGVHVSGSADPVQSALSEQGVFTGVPSAQTALPEAPAVPQLPQAQGFSVAPPSSHKYLIETNPELTNLKQFMGSDYLLGNLGYDPDAAQKRLGDGLYEQRLVREAVVARTGQRFLAGLTSDEAMYRYLMDNALASKDALGLSLGVTLSGEQVAALTHDIVWLEEHEVNGEKVLVPVLYLAQAEGRLAANGALIQGRDVTLISGGELLNQGTLRASENLTATAGNINNSGLIEAGERLQLLATDSIRNAQGGIIAGRDVSLTALTGDVINERSVTRHEVNFGNRHDVKDYVDSAARIEAANSLSIVAGRDVANLGAVLESGGDLSINAGRDVTFASVEERVSQARGGSYLNERVTQIGAQASAGRDLEISAGRDLSAIASQLDARRDLALEAGGDVLLASAANEDHFYSRSKKVTRSTDKVVQQSTTVQAGRDISIAANEDLTLVASQVKAGNNVSLDAEQDINILSAKDESASFYFKKKKGSFGRSSSKQQEKYDSTNIASVVEAGNDLTLNASKTADGGMSIDGGRDVTIIGSQLQAGGDLLVGATGDVAVLSGVEEHGSYSKKTKSGFLGLSKSGKSQLKTKASQVASELDADNDVVIAAGNDIRLRASETSAGNDLELRAGLVNDTGDINLVSANDTAYSLTEQYKKKVGLSASGGFVSIASAKEAGKEAQSSTSVGSQVTADRDAALQAERDINVIGSGISAGRNLSLDAGRDVNVVSAENSSAQRDWEKNKQVGIGVSSDDNGVSVFVGAERIQEKNRQLRETAAASQLSAGRDLDIAAGRDINQTGSDLLALNDINLQAGRDIKIDAAREALLLEQQRSEERQGLGVTVNHNFGNTKEAASNAGKGENGVSQASSTLRAVDSISQFLSGPTADVRLGNSKQSSSQQYSEQSNRSSTLSAGNDLNLQANNDVTVKGGQLDAGRDINIKGRDVTLDVARGNVAQESEQSQSWAGVQGGTSGGLKLGIGGSRGVASEDGTQGTSTATQLAAGRDINMQASNDLTLIGSQAQAGRDIDLKAGNDLDIRAVQNASRSESERRSAGGEVGLSISPQGVGPYVSANLGKGQLERVGQRQQEAYLYAGDRLSFSSGEDTRIAGAILRGDEVIGRVGGDLSLSSLPDTGSVKGKEFDLSGTVSMTGISGSIGAGKTTGKTNWVQEQTSITARDRLDIRTENHTQIDGAIIASDTGNLKLDTDTLGYSDIAGQDKERAYYLNVGGSFGLGGGTPQDASQVGKGEQGVNGWSVEGYNYERDREQIVRATVGAGDIVVRSDAETGEDSTAGLNRDVSKAYEITKDKEERTDLYVSKSSVEAVGNADETLKSWGKALANYDEKTKETFKELGVLANASLNELEKLTGRPLAEGAINAGGAEIAEQALHGLIMSGMSLDQAKALLADQAFQDQVLAELRGISLVFSAEPEVLRQTEQGLAAANVNVSPDALELADSVVKGTKEEPRLNQVILDRVSAVNSYIKANPGKEEAVGYVLAAAQGPKGLIMWAAEKALSETPFGEKVAQYEAHLKDLLGKAIAEGIEDRGLEAEDYNDAYLLGGGGLIATLLVGAAVSGSSSKVIKVKESGSPATNQNSHAGQADNETGYPLPDRPVVGGAKGPGAAEVPATSAITRDGLRNDLAAQAGIPRSLDKVWGASVDDLAQAYKMDGATLVPKPALSGTSGKAQAFTVEGHPTMKEVQVHPGGGTHGAPYYKFTYKDGAEVRVIDPASGFKPGTITSVQQYFDTAGNRLRYEAGQWKLWE